jgi:hypothetical protein
MADPVVFLSHFTIKEGSLEALKRYAKETTRALEEEKPRTGVLIAFISDAGTRASFIHVFDDADAMDAHIEGANERSRAASDFMEPLGWEIYGKPSEAASEMFEQAAAGAGVELRAEPEYLAGFLRLQTPG